jgi:adenylate cyclase
MESHGIPGTIQVAERARAFLDGAFELEERGVIDIKGKGGMRTFLLVGRKDPGSRTRTARVGETKQA